MASVKQLEAEIEHLKEMVGLLRSVAESQKCCGHHQYHCSGCNCFKVTWTTWPTTTIGTTGYTTTYGTNGLTIYGGGGSGSADTGPAS